MGWCGLSGRMPPKTLKRPNTAASSGTSWLLKKLRCVKWFCLLALLVACHIALKKKILLVFEIYALVLFQGWGYGLGRSLSAVASCAVTSAVLLTGQRAVASGALTVEGMTAFFFYVAFVAGSSFDVGEQWTRIQQALGAGKSVFALASREPVRFHDAPVAAAPVAAAAEPPHEATSHHDHPEALSSRTPTHAEAADGVAAKLELTDVHFEYPGRPGAPVLRGLTLAVRPGEVLGLVGGSGGGKSTVIRLLCGFYAAQRGSVQLNGKDVLRGYSPAELARTIAWVTQEPQLFPVSVAENIAYGLPAGSWTMDDVERCVRVASSSF